MFVAEEKPVPVIFEAVKLDGGYRADMAVERKMVIANKAVDEQALIHVAQLLTHLRFLELRYGLLPNFNTLHLKDGLKRDINEYAQVK